MTAPRRSPSLIRKTMFHAAIPIAVVVAIATVISYFHVSNSLQKQALEQLEEYLNQRAMRESAIFLLATDNLRGFAKAYARRLPEGNESDPSMRFAELFERREDGSTRLRRRYFAAHSLTGVIGKQVVIDADLRRRLVTAFDLLVQYGPAWQNRFVNLYVTTPEGAILMFWPAKPWGLNANSWEINARLALNAPDEEPVLVIDAAQRAPRVAGWSPLYFDYAVNAWTVSATEPVNMNGRNQVSVGHDMLLDELIERSINNRLEGTYNLILRDDGRLLAHPHFMDAIQARNGELAINDTGDPHLQRIFDRVVQRPSATAIIDNSADGEYLAMARLQGPGWLLVTVFPKAIITALAFKTARIILLLGAVALLLEIAIVFLVLRRQVARPLAQLLTATNRVAAGDFDIQLDVRKQDEIGRLAQSLNTMSQEINARETSLNERSVKLAQLNEQLEQELEEHEKADQEIVRQREALHQSEKLNALGSLLAGVAHELNNPLSVVVGRTIMLEEQLRGAPQAKAMAKIRLAAERCAKIVKTFLAMARQHKPARVSVQIEDIIHAALDLLSYGFKADGIEVDLEFESDLPEISADPDQLGQVFTNLFANAQHALAETPGRKLLGVTADFDRESHTLRVQVRDNGPGIPQTLVPRIFEPFFTTKAVGQGTGLGLSVSRGVIEAHDGTLRVDAPTEGGTVFEITLPVSLPAERRPTEMTTPEGGLLPRRILILESSVDRHVLC